MIISDLQYIESANNTDVQGGFSFADALANATAVGNVSFSVTDTFAVAVPGGANSGSRSTAFSASYKRSRSKRYGK